MGNAEVYLKLENFQLTGSFKVRGALNKLLTLSEAEKAMGVVAASSGNHGAGLAYGMNKLGIPGSVFVPQDASPSKLDLIRGYKVEVSHHGKDCVEAEAFARTYAAQYGMTYISPYNDPDVIAGQGTVGVELTEQLDQFDAIFIALGGGGLLSGVGRLLKSHNPEVEIVACSPENSAVMHHSINAGKILDMASLPTLSDGTTGGLEAGSMTFSLCRTLVDTSILVTEQEISEALIRFISEHHMLIEGAAAVPVAAFSQHMGAYKGKRIVLLICGANIDLQTLKTLL
jgi:threonine dehydratase